MEILFAFLCVLFIVLSVLYAVYRKAFYNSRKKKRDKSVLPDGAAYRAVKSLTDPLVEEIRSLPFEDVEIKSREGITLRGKYYEVREGAPLQIQFHGYRGSWQRDFCGGNKLARELGFNTLVVEQRAHGESGGRTISFGIKERFDCLCWIEYAVTRFGENTDIVLAGVSMGASTVIMAAGEKLPPSVRCVIADCPYSSPFEIIMKVCGDMGLPRKLCSPLVKGAAKLFGGFDLTQTDCIKAVKKAEIPILIIHGEADDFVPISMSRKIAEAAPRLVSFHSFPLAGHGLSYVVDTEGYKRVAEKFLNEIISLEKA